MVSSWRVVIEHAHSGIKRLIVAQDPLRLPGEWVRKRSHRCGILPAQPARPRSTSSHSGARTR